MLYRIHQSDSLILIPAYEFFMAHYDELVRTGLTIPLETITPSEYSVVYATTEDNVVGCIVYHIIDDCLRIVLSAVDMDHRGKGLYQLMRDHLEQHAVTIGCTHIKSWTHIKNKSMQRAAEKAGSKISGVVLGKYIK